MSFIEGFANPSGAARTWRASLGLGMDNETSRSNRFRELGNREVNWNHKNFAQVNINGINGLPNNIYGDLLSQQSHQLNGYVMHKNNPLAANLVNPLHMDPFSGSTIGNITSKFVSGTGKMFEGSKSYQQYRMEAITESQMDPNNPDSVESIYNSLSNPSATTGDPNLGIVDKLNRQNKQNKKSYKNNDRTSAIVNLFTSPSMESKILESQVNDHNTHRTNDPVIVPSLHSERAMSFIERNSSIAASVSNQDGTIPSNVDSNKSQEEYSRVFSHRTELINTIISHPSKQYIEYNDDDSLSEIAMDRSMLSSIGQTTGGVTARGRMENSLSYSDVSSLMRGAEDVINDHNATESVISNKRNADRFYVGHVSLPSSTLSEMSSFNNLTLPSMNKSYEELQREAPELKNISNGVITSSDLNIINQEQAIAEMETSGEKPFVPGFGSEYSDRVQQYAHLKSEYEFLQRAHGKRYGLKVGQNPNQFFPFSTTAPIEYLKSYNAGANTKRFNDYLSQLEKFQSTIKSRKMGTPLKASNPMESNALNNLPPELRKKQAINSQYPSTLDLLSPSPNLVYPMDYTPEVTSLPFGGAFSNHNLQHSTQTAQASTTQLSGAINLFANTPAYSGPIYGNSPYQNPDNPFSSPVKQQTLFRDPKKKKIYTKAFYHENMTNEEIRLAQRKKYNLVKNSLLDKEARVRSEKTLKGIKSKRERKIQKRRERDQLWHG